MPKVSIVVPCYNQGEFLSDTLDSVLSQTYSNWECIIVNDGSTDNTSIIARLYCEKDQRLSYIEQKNSGLSIARNVGINASKGVFILPLDSDDKIGSEYLESCIKAFGENPNLKVVYSRAELFGLAKGEWKLPPFSMERMLGRNCIFCSAIFKKEDFIKVGGYNPNMKYGFEDWDFWLSIIEEDCDVYQIDKILFYYRIRNKSMVRSIDEKKSEFLRRQIWENHKELFSKYFFNPIESFEYQGMKKYLDSYNYKIKTKINKIVSFFKF